MNKMDFVVLAQDKRYEYLASLLQKDQNNVYIWGEEDIMGVRNVLSLYLLENKVNLILPLNIDNEKQIYALRSVPEGSNVFGGELCFFAEKILTEKNIKYFNVLKESDFTELNAIPTAEGALYDAIGRTDYTINGSHVLVLGFGYVAKAVAKLFYAAGANITIAARNPEQLVIAKENGYFIEKLPLESLSGFDLIINTIPKKDILPYELLESIDEQAIILELASGKENINIDSCDILMIPLIRLPGLPGKIAPLSAAVYLKDTIYRLLSTIN